MSRISLVVKVTNGCNLRCKYCYNGEEGFKPKKLSLEHFDKALRMLAKENNEIVVIWHGGEPLTCGIDYYKKAMKIEEELKLDFNVEIENHVQTNGTLINNEWVKFFVKNKFKVGMSFDGIHNETYRGETQKTLNAMDLLKKNKIRFGAMAVVVDGDYDLIENYKFFAERQIPIEFSHMIPEGSGKNLAQLSANEYAENTCKLFDYWLHDKNGVPIRMFNSFIVMALGGPARICDHSSCHGKYLCINADGDLFNCSRSAIHKYCFGNIENVNELSEVFASEGFKNLVMGSIKRRNACKASCPYFELCKGGCADVAICNGDVSTPSEYTCICFRTVFAHIKNAVDEIVKNQIPLDELNPTVKGSFARAMKETENEDYGCGRCS